MTVFLVDDHKPFLDSFAINAEPEWDLHCFFSAKEALAEITKLNPSVIISDVQMPDFHGVDFLNIIKLISFDITLIMISAYTLQEVKDMFGVVDGAKFFRKPLTKDNLLEIENIIKEAPKINLENVISFDLIDENLKRLRDIVRAFSNANDPSNPRLNYLKAHIDIGFKFLGIEDKERQDIFLKKWGNK